MSLCQKDSPWSDNTQSGGGIKYLSPWSDNTQSNKEKVPGTVVSKRDYADSLLA